MITKHDSSSDNTTSLPYREKPTRRRSLGRGLDSILPEFLGDKSFRSKEVTMVPITMVSRNPNQVRKDFPKESITELARSIALHGVLQPVIVRPQAGGRYEIIAGERRWRAAQEAGMTEIPIIVRQASEKQVAEINLIENLHRSDLNPIETAEAIVRLMKEHGYTQEQLAERLCRSRSSLANLVRLLDLPIPIQEMIRAGKITEGHGRALLMISDERTMIKLAMDISPKGLSVREIENIAARITRQSVSGFNGHQYCTSPEIRELCERLQKKLGTRVNLHHTKKGRGKMEIHYRNLDELNRILSLIFKK